MRQADARGVDNDGKPHGSPCDSDSHNAIECLLFVSFSNRQSEKINEVYASTSITWTASSGDSQSPLAGPTQASVDKRFFLDQEALDESRTPTRSRPTCRRTQDPGPPNIWCAAAKWTSVLGFIMPPGSVRYNEKAF